MLEPPPPPPGVEPDQDDIGIKFKSFDLNKVEHEPPRTLAGYEAEVKCQFWIYMKIVSLLIFYYNLHISQITLGNSGKWIFFFQMKDSLKKTMYSLGSFFFGLFKESSFWKNGSKS